MGADFYYFHLQVKKLRMREITHGEVRLLNQVCLTTVIMTSFVSSMQGQQHVQSQAGGNTAYHFGKTIPLWLERRNPGEMVRSKYGRPQSQTVNSLGSRKTKKASEENNKSKQYYMKSSLTIELVGLEGNRKQGNHLAGCYASLGTDNEHLNCDEEVKIEMNGKINETSHRQNLLR